MSRRHPFFLAAPQDCLAEVVYLVCICICIYSFMMLYYPLFACFLPVLFHMMPERSETIAFDLASQVGRQHQPLLRFLPLACFAAFRSAHFFPTLPQEMGAHKPLGNTQHKSRLLAYCPGRRNHPPLFPPASLPPCINQPDGSAGHPLPSNTTPPQERNAPICKQQNCVP